MKNRKAFSRDERKRMILLAFAAEIQSGNDGEMTLPQIAHWMHVTASTKLRMMVKELIDDGLLFVRQEAIPGVCKYRWIYSVNRENRHIAQTVYLRPARQAIKINTAQGTFFAQLDGQS